VYAVQKADIEYWTYSSDFKSLYPHLIVAIRVAHSLLAIVIRVRSLVSYVRRSGRHLPDHVDFIRVLRFLTHKRRPRAILRPNEWDLFMLKYIFFLYRCKNKLSLNFNLMSFVILDEWKSGFSLFDLAISYRVL